MTIDHISQANYPFYGQLPMGVTNFGGDIQVSTVPDFSRYQIGCALNGQGLDSINGYNNNAPIINNWGFTPTNTNPFYPGMERGLQQVSGGLASQKLSTNLQTIAAAKQHLNSMLLNDKYTKKQKEVINKLIDRLTEEETKLNDLSAEVGLKPTEVYKKADAIEKNIRNILNDISRVGAPGEKPSTTGGANNNNDKSEVENDENGDGVADYATFSDEGMLMAEQFYNAVEGPGTDDAAFNEVCENITPENVIDVMQAYNEMHSAQHGESFMHAFMYDADRSQKIQYGKHIKSALMIRAREAGVLHKCQADFAAIDREMNSWVYVDNDVYKNYDNIIKIIAEAEGQPYKTDHHKESKDGTGATIATGLGAAAGAAIGAKIGAFGGPVGIAICSAVGGAIGWLGKKLFG